MRPTPQSLTICEARNCDYDRIAQNILTPLMQNLVGIDLRLSDDFSLLSGGHHHGNCFALSSSCAGLVGDWPQECIHRDNAAGYFTQTLRKPKGRLFPTGEDIAQMRIGALSSLGKVFDGPPSGFSPTKHRMWF